VLGLTRNALDVTRPEEVRRVIREAAPSVVINATAYTKVDLAETDRMAAEILNAHAPAFLASACGEVGATFVHFSTDQVFDGKTAAPYREEDPTHPLNWYARTKLEGERAALAYEESLVLRVQWLYGETKDRFSGLRDQHVFTPFSDQVGAPTWTRDIVSAIPALLARGARGLYHFTYDDHASWADVFAFVKDHWNLAVELKPRPTAQFDLPAARPLFSVLSNAKLKKTLGVEKLGNWRDSLREFLDLRS
jgi:dTDP-4-dehydrorhamnose reductase